MRSDAAWDVKAGGRRESVPAAPVPTPTGAATAPGRRCRQHVERGDPSDESCPDAPPRLGRPTAAFGAARWTGNLFRHGHDRPLFDHRRMRPRDDPGRESQRPCLCGRSFSRRRRNHARLAIYRNAPDPGPLGETLTTSLDPMQQLHLLLAFDRTVQRIENRAWQVIRSPSD